MVVCKGNKRERNMNCIVAADKNWAIGKDNGLLVHLPEDLKYYKEKTIGKVIVIGRKTLESFPGGKPLPNRTNLVLTGNPKYKNDSCTVCCGIDALEKEMEKYSDKDIFVSGGAMIYNLFLDRCDVVYVTKLYDEFEADTYFPNMDKKENYKVTWESDIMEEKGVSYRFVKYEKIK